MSDEVPEAPEALGGERKARKSIAISRSAAWAGGGGLTLGTFALLAQLNGFYFTRQEGVATNRNVERIEKLVNQNKDEIVKVMTAEQTENTRILEQKIDRVLELMGKAEDRAAKIDDRQDRKIENLELIVFSNKPRGR